VIVNHLPRQPSWECADCGTPWPCDEARNRLNEQLLAQRVATTLYLASCLMRAAEDLGISPSELAVRFLTLGSLHAEDTRVWHVQVGAAGTMVATDEADGRVMVVFDGAGSTVPIDPSQVRHRNPFAPEPPGSDN
jgi:hypothetical protein